MLELLLLLLDASEPQSRAQIFAAIPAYQTAKPAAGERKFERDKKDLRESGVPLSEELGETNVYSVDRRSYELPEVHLDDEERAALVLAAEAVRSTEGLVYRDLVDDALHKLCFERDVGAGDLPPHLAVAMTPRRRGRSTRTVLAKLTSAAEGCKRVRITYQAKGKEPTEREVDPHVIVYRAGDWLLVGHCHARKAERTFRVDRIKKVRVAPRPGTPDFEPPGAEVLARAMASSPWVFQAGASGQMEIELDVGPERHWVSDEEFGAGARRRTQADGWTRVSFRSGNPDYIVTRILDGGGQLRIVAPAALRARVVAIAGAVAALYTGTGPATP